MPQPHLSDLITVPYSNQKREPDRKFESRAGRVAQAQKLRSCCSQFLNYGVRAVLL